MPYSFTYPSSFKRELRNVPQEAQQIIEDIITDPSIGKPLRDNLKGYRNVSFGRKPEYRILYVIDYKCKRSKWGKTSCKYDICSAEEIKDCLGYIEFKYALPREALNNIYRLRKKDLR